jgi:hypothetical protein
MVAGIEQLYKRIADAMTTSIPEDWSVAEVHAIFYSDSSTYEAEYVREADGRAIGFQQASDGARAIRELRKAFRLAGLPVWGQVRFIVRSDGSFNAQWGYDGCDANGDLPFDEEAELRRHEERRQRLLAGKPRHAETGAASDRNGK